MKSIERAHIVVVAGGKQGRSLTARLLRMRAAQVTTVNGVDEARRLCGEGGPDLCLVAVADAVLDVAQPVTEAAPGRESGTPSLMLTEAVTAYSRQIARRAGYCAAIPAGIAPQMLYRRIGAALQRRRVKRRRWPHAFSPDIAGYASLKAVEMHKPTLH